MLAMFLVFFFHEFCTNVQTFGCEFTHTCASWLCSGMCARSYLVFPLCLGCSFPDVMMPSYARNPWSCVFFIVYLSIELYFIMNLVSPQGSTSLPSACFWSSFLSRVFPTALQSSQTLWQNTPRNGSLATDRTLLMSNHEELN